MKLLRLFFPFLLCITFIAPRAHAAPPESFAPIVEPLMPAVVNISTTQKVAAQTGVNPELDGIPDAMQNEQLRQFFRQFGGGPMGGLSGMNPRPNHPATSLGSGFIIDPDGYIVTNNHVVGNADAITVILQDNTHLIAILVGRDEKTDLALLKVKPAKPLVAVKFGDSEALHIGDWVIAVGDPFGLGGSVSAGIVSARGRNINAGPFDDFIQTDAAINRGNSGGPLFNTKGEVVGINAAIFSPTGGNIGIGFAVPSAMAKSVVSQLREFGTIHRGWLGVKIEVVSDELANAIGLPKARGALLRDLDKPGPAADAGLQAGDVILTFDGHPIDEMRKLPRFVADAKIGKKADVTYWRRGHEVTTQVTIGEVVKDRAAASEMRKPMDENDAPKTLPNLVLGMKLVPLTPEVRAQFDIKNDIKGVLVTAIDVMGDAAKRGIIPGDIVLEVNQTPVDSVEAVRSCLAQAKKAGRDFALLRVVRKNESLFATVSVKEFK